MAGKVESSAFLAQKKPVFRELLGELLSRYTYASILATDVEAKNYAVSRAGIRIAEDRTFGKRGFTARVFYGDGYLEYSGSDLTKEDIPGVLQHFAQELEKQSDKYTVYATPEAADEEASFIASTEYETDPRVLGDEAIVEKLSAVREKTLSEQEGLLECQTRYQFQVYHKLFLSRSRDLEQNVMHGSCAVVCLARRGEEIKDGYHSDSVLGGAELLDHLALCAREAMEAAKASLAAEPLVPGEYDCICTPPVTGMIVHEAFGHGVEMDMFVKDRAQARSFMGKQVASELVTMKDGAATDYQDVASYFFDDEGNLASDTVVIDKGILVSGISDGLSDARLGTRPTGNGRRESVDHKAYTRMTNTFFLAGTSKPEEMIAGVENGLLLDCPSSGMEDPKNWGIQCMVSFGREIRDGKLTGRVFGPIVLTGYVPDLLKSISMVSDTVEHNGAGACGKGWKEWVKVSDGGPWIRARIRLG